MTTYPTDAAAPPADERSITVPTATEEIRTIQVPLCALLDDDVILCHPETGESVVWRVVDWRSGDGAYVTYTEPGSDEEHRVEFNEPQPMLLVEHPAGVSR